MTYQPTLRKTLALSLLLITWGCTDAKLNELKARFGADSALKAGLLPSVSPSGSPQASGSPDASASPGASVTPPPTTPTPKPTALVPATPVELVLGSIPLRLALTSSPVALSGQVKMSDGQLLEGVNWAVNDSSIAKIESDKLVLLKEGSLKVTASAQVNPSIQKELYLVVGATAPVVSPSAGASASPSPSASPSAAKDTFNLSAITGSFDDLETGNDKLYVSDQTKNQVHVIDTLTGKLVASIQVSSAPKGMDLSPDGSRLYVASGGVAGVDVIDTATNTKLEMIPADFKVYDVVSSNDRIFVSFYGAGFEEPVAIDLATKKKVATFPKYVHSNSRLAITKDNSTVYVGAVGGSPASLYKIDVTQDPPKLVIEDEHGAIGSNLRGMALSYDEKEIYLACGAPYYIQILDVNTFKPAGQFTTDAYPESVAITADGKYVFAAYSHRAIKVFDRATQQMLINPKFGYEIRRLVVSSDGKRVFGIQDRGSNLDGLYQLITTDKITVTPSTPTPAPVQ